MKVSIVFGSKSDLEVMKGAAICLDEFDIGYELYAISAHRTPELLESVIKNFEEDGTEIIIAGAGLAAHLPGVIASKTILPVVGVPIKSSLDGLDSLLSIVQMPKQVPVATVGINNSYNAAVLSVEILSLKYPEIKEKLLNYRLKIKEKFVSEYKLGNKI